jgi:hypothetical protein
MLPFVVLPLPLPSDLSQASRDVARTAIDTFLYHFPASRPTLQFISIHPYYSWMDRNTEINPNPNPKSGKPPQTEAK